MKSAAIIGFGRVGTAMGSVLDSSGWQVLVVTKNSQPGQEVMLNGRKMTASPLHEAAEKAEVLFITTPDAVITRVAHKLAAMDIQAKAALHLSGSLTAGILSPLSVKGLMTGSLHPLQSFATVEQAVTNLPGSFFTYEGDVGLIPLVTELVGSLDGVLKILPSADSKVIYHTGACYVSNYLVALASLGIKCLEQAGFSADEARKALSPLMKGAVNNISALPLTQALTGPISRGDLDTVRQHIAVMKRDLPQALEPYLILSPILAGIALEAGKLSVSKHRELLAIIKKRGVMNGQDDS